MVSSWLPKSTLLLVGLLAASASAATATAANSDADGHLQTATKQQQRQQRRRRASLRAAATPDAIDAEADPVDDMIQDRKAGRRQDRKLKKDSKKKSSKKKSGGSGGSNKKNDNNDAKDSDTDKKDDSNADKQAKEAKQPTTSTAGTYKQTSTSTNTSTKPTTSTATSTTGTYNGKTFTLPPGVPAGYNTLPNGYYKGTSSGASTENNFQTWTVKDPSQVGRNPEGGTSSGGTSTVANVPMMSCEGGGGDNQDMTFFGVKFGQCSNADPCLAAVMPSRMAYYCPLQFRPYCGGKCYTVASACPDGKIHDAVGGTWDVSDPRWWQAESSAWGGAWPYNFGEPACTHSAASFC